ncbi:DUF397 domain-containing protein [Streptomyces sp. 5-10]|uniref:DUF397 domain-containing protein n=1 Tax=Streptomyces sp. 5-10 TaxID=878925 RepID=UPI00351A7E02
MKPVAPSGPSWFKSSYSSGEGGECLEVAITAHAVSVRDSKDTTRPGLTVDRPHGPASCGTSPTRRERRLQVVRHAHNGSTETYASPIRPIPPASGPNPLARPNPTPPAGAYAPRGR